jgi:glycerol-3-phosphate dehydrogenase
MTAMTAMTTTPPIALPLPTRRADLLARLAQSVVYDMVVVGGGATGLGVALDAAARGFSVVLIESHDFAKGASSRSTKLVHGGVRYLAQGRLTLVQEALHERRTLLRNAPHLAQPLAFVLPSYHYWEAPFYGVGLKLYDALAGQAGLGTTEFLSREHTLQCLPTARAQGLKGGVKYWDGQFDDARMALALARTAAQHGALLVNYCQAKELLYDKGRVAGLICTDTETGQHYTLRTRCVVNATGVWVDALRQQDGEALQRPVKPLVAPSQGVHIAVDREFLPSNHALMVPKTADGRVLFAVPWLGKVILGTTDSPRPSVEYEPRALHHELAFILGESARYLRRAPTAADIRSIWVGLRPLVKPQGDSGQQTPQTPNTQNLSREHTVLASPSGLVTVTGGKWTTYRLMAEDVLQKCFTGGVLAPRVGGVTVHLPLVGAPAGPLALPQRLCDAQGWHSYGSEADAVRSLPGAGVDLGGGLTAAMVRFAARYEYARTVEDVLARRWRTLFLDAQLAATLAPAVAALLQPETGVDPQLEAFVALAAQYLQLPSQRECKNT